MARRDDGLLETLFELGARLPWWLSVLLAIFAYLVLSHFAAQPAPDIALSPRGPTMIQHYLRALALVGQYILPFAFMVGAMTSILVRQRGRQLYRQVAQKPARDSLQGLNWREFEILMLEWFAQQGYQVQDTQLGADGGVDIVLRKAGKTYFVQCKHWRAYKVGVGIVRELRGVMASEGAVGGFVVTSGIFTDEARRFAARNEITLIDGRQLTAAIGQHSSAQRTMAAPSAYKNDNTQSLAEPTCPRCGATMVERKASRGAAAGRYFWGCSRYPTCRGTRSAEDTE